MGMMIIVLLLVLLITLYVFNSCAFCKCILTDEDRRLDGEYKYYRKNSELPVCTECAKLYPGDVDNG